MDEMNLGDRMKEADRKQELLVRMKEADRKQELLARVERSMTNVTPTAESIERIEQVRQTGKELAASIMYNCPLSREQSLALTHLEDAVMWAVKSIVLEEGE